MFSYSVVIRYRVLFNRTLRWSLKIILKLKRLFPLEFNLCAGVIRRIRLNGIDMYIFTAADL